MANAERADSSLAFERRHCLEHSGVEEQVEANVNCLGNLKSFVEREFTETRKHISSESALFKWLLGAACAAVLGLIGYLTGQLSTLSSSHRDLKEVVSVNTEKIASLKAFDERVDRLLANLEQVLRDKQ